MSDAAVGETNLVGISAVLHTLQTHGQLPRQQLLDRCTEYGLRGGAVSWEVAIKIAVTMKLVIVGGRNMSLSRVGSSIARLVGADMEPSEEFGRAILAFSIGQSSSRYALAQALLDGLAIQDPRGAAAPLLEDLVEVGLVAVTGNGEWTVQASEFSPLLIGLLLSAPKGAAVASAVGELGEQLSLRYYREQGWEPLHVSPVSPNYGFDVLCRPLAAGEAPPVSLAVEAKGTTGAGPYRFFATRHELRVARQLGQRYEIAVWGEIDLGASLDDNYLRLRAREFPRIVRDPYLYVETHAPGLLTGRAILNGTVSADGVVWHHA